MKKNNPEKKSYRALLAVIALCAAPIIASYLTYYVIKPTGRTNYGSLLDPRHYPMPAFSVTTLAGQTTTLKTFSGKWLMLQIDVAECEKTCQQKLYQMRQVRLTQGKEMERIERVWLITDQNPLDTILIRKYDGTRMLRVEAAV